MTEDITMVKSWLVLAIIINNKDIALEKCLKVHEYSFEIVHRKGVYKIHVYSLK